MKYHIKPLGMIKSQGFNRDLYGDDLFFIPVETTWTLQQYHIKPKSIFKNPADFY